jgi:hypothetical protein
MIDGVSDHLDCFRLVDLRRLTTDSGHPHCTKTQSRNLPIQTTKVPILHGAPPTHKPTHKQLIDVTQETQFRHFLKQTDARQVRHQFAEKESFNFESTSLPRDPEASINAARAITFEPNPVISPFHNKRTRKVTE